MAALTIKHITTYRYKQPVGFGEHRMMLRPRDGHDQAVIDATIVITPTPTSIRRTQDAFGNHVDVAHFADRAKKLRFESTVHLDHSHADFRDLDIEECARTYPFVYSAEELPDLVHLIERKSFDPDCQVARWARSFLRTGQAARCGRAGRLTCCTAQPATGFCRHFGARPALFIAPVVDTDAEAARALRGARPGAFRAFEKAYHRSSFAQWPGAGQRRPRWRTRTTGWGTTAPALFGI
jgi:Bacterial transglutaminase-like N-terminal region